VFNNREQTFVIKIIYLMQILLFSIVSLINTILCFLIISVSWINFITLELAYHIPFLWVLALAVDQLKRKGTQ